MRFNEDKNNLKDCFPSFILFQSKSFGQAELFYTLVLKYHDWSVCSFYSKGYTRIFWNGYHTLVVMFSVQVACQDDLTAFRDGRQECSLRFCSTKFRRNRKDPVFKIQNRVQERGESNFKLVEEYWVICGSTRPGSFGVAWTCPVLFILTPVSSRFTPLAFAFRKSPESAEVLQISCSSRFTIPYPGLWDLYGTWWVRERRRWPAVKQVNKSALGCHKLYVKEMATVISISNHGVWSLRIPEIRRSVVWMDSLNVVGVTNAIKQRLRHSITRLSLRLFPLNARLLQLKSEMACKIRQKRHFMQTTNATLVKPFLLYAVNSAVSGLKHGASNYKCSTGVVVSTLVWQS